LDPLVRTELRDDLRAIFRSLAKTVIVVTHDVGEAAHLADVVVLMRAGRVVQQGPFATLGSAPADPFVTAFLATGNGGAAPARETRGRSERSGARCLRASPARSPAVTRPTARSSSRPRASPSR